MPDLKDGETVEVKGSAAKPYQLKNVGGVYSCTCPAWRNQSTPIEARTCKHLRKLRGDAAELERIGGELPPRPKKAASQKDGPSLLLAQTWDNAMDLADWWMSEKLDGVRAYWDGKCFLSRQGNQYHAPEWFTEGLPNTPLDGELWIGRKAFQRTVSIVRRQDKSDHWKDVRYLVFDAPRHAGEFEARLKFVTEWFQESEHRYAMPHQHQRCTGVPHLEQELDRIEALKGEGLMLREPGSKYEIGRSSTLVKVKRFHDCEAIVLAHQPGKGKFKGLLGAIAAQLEDGTEFSVGTGFSDAERASPPPVGSIITFRYQEFSDGGVPRFPSFVRVHQAESSRKTRKSATSKSKAVSSKSKAVRSLTPATQANEAAARYFELVDDKSNKFWEISVNADEVTVRYGRIGSNGVTKVKALDDAAEAAKHAATLITQKTKRGYVET